MQTGIKVRDRIPTLDGWRCVAISLVLLTHFQAGYIHHYFFNAAWMNLGQHGVTIFFVLSGYLITSNLLAEKEISLPRFYWRRFFRLMPAAWTYLLVLIFLGEFTRLQVNGGVIASLAFFRNYIPETALNTCTGHFWSLSLEEQFYLVWPPVLVLLADRKKSIVLLSAAVTGIAIYRMARWQYYMYGLRCLYSEVRADALLVGCLLAFLLQYEGVRNFFRSHGSKLFPICACFLLIDIFRFHTLIPAHEDVLIALLIGSTVHNPSMLPSRILEIGHLKTTGKVSYGIYLWQGLLLRANLGVFGLFLLPVSVALSWNFIEKPCIAWGARLWHRIDHSPIKCAEVQAN